jgi:hypothetical protein
MRVCHRLLESLVALSASYSRSAYALAALLASYLIYSSLAFPRGGSWMGIIYGGLALLLILALFYYGIRKRSYGDAGLSLETWLRSHYSLGVLVLFVVLFHSGFRFHDRVAVILFVLMCAVIASGFAGALLYAMIPSRLINVESSLTAPAISDEINRLAEAILRLAVNKSAALQSACRAVIEAERPAPAAGWRILRSAHFARRTARQDLAAFFNSLRGITSEEQGDLTRLRELSQQMRDLHDRLIRKQRYVNLMSVWLYVHVPVSLAMLVFLLAHILGAFYYWGFLPGS